MPEMRVVSTFNPQHWPIYVKRNVESWLGHVDAELVIYHEGEHPPPISDPRVVWRRWEDIPGAADFVAEAATFPPACGLFRGRYDYNYDAHKFARKVFAQCDAAEEHTDLLVWLDSDVEVLRRLNADTVAEFLNGMPMARYERPGFHTETGVVLWDMRMGAAEEFFPAYRALYDNRRIYCLPKGWHDCWALDFVVDKLGIPTADLCKRRKDYASPHAVLEVVSDSALGAYLRHDKGNRKAA